jgi:hypothetical protein
MNETVIDNLAAMMHHTICQEKEREGYHHPTKCPNFEKQYDEEGEVMDADLVHCSHCDINMTDFSNLEHYVIDTYRKKADELLGTMKEFGLEVSLVSGNSTV